MKKIKRVLAVLRLGHVEANGRQNPTKCASSGTGIVDDKGERHVRVSVRGNAGYVRWASGWCRHRFAEGNGPVHVEDVEESVRDPEGPGIERSGAGAQRFGGARACRVGHSCEYFAAAPGIRRNDR